MSVECLERVRLDALREQKREYCEEREGRGEEREGGGEEEREGREKRRGRGEYIPYTTYIRREFYLAFCFHN